MPLAGPGVVRPKTERPGGKVDGIARLIYDPLQNNDQNEPI
ncbi:hypothetical protein [Roseiconus lacunae]|uniref:Uncharacterized protein n=1 Tax=Roseiconus lacunae TaxID=2605694 RepID=A0ABT7PKV6_9BACT|nr:hypothetical protein [Roseiconus lacunae]MDM4017105.1 hypothetical protein [Roseiconus lacunae]